MIKVFNINCLKKKIFKFIRKEAKIICNDCKKICYWDNEIRTFFITYNLNYCSKCYSNYSHSHYLSAYT